LDGHGVLSAILKKNTLTKIINLKFFILNIERFLWKWLLIEVGLLDWFYSTFFTVLVNLLNH
ncbi:hypothetical protein, partial [Bacillus toyonensis]|uniref:hypothetical protein n=1 Tax=Bacillus toyonensis TaxID=155322 RepID=UPI000C02DB58